MINIIKINITARYAIFLVILQYFIYIKYYNNDNFISVTNCHETLQVTLLK